LNVMTVDNSSPLWEAYFTEHNQRGYMINQATPQEKFKFMQKNFQVGDVVLLYRKSSKSKRDSLGVIDSCYPAVIRAFDANSVFLEYFPNCTTYLTTFYNLDMVREQLQNEGKKSIYTDEDY